MPAVRTDFPHGPRSSDNFIAYFPVVVRDGVKLAAALWTPTKDVRDAVVGGTSLAEGLPVIVECVPYRRTDGTALRDSKRHPYLAGFGFITVRVDLRGSGDSEGILDDEYSEQELADICDVVEFVASRPFCNGKVGMFGKSWGAFNAVQVAALQPKGLAAIIAVSGTVDRYNEDVHYLGGCVQQFGMLPWASVMLGYNSLPPDPHATEAWRERWLERLDQTQPMVLNWLKHQRRDSYWNHGSVSEFYASIRVPVLCVGGLADGYTSFVFKLLHHLPDDVPCFGVLAPCSHQYPEESFPGPSIPWNEESVLWWSRWLMSDAQRSRIREWTASWGDFVGKMLGANQNHVLRAFVLEKEPHVALTRAYPAIRKGFWVAATADELPLCGARVGDMPDQELIANFAVKAAPMSSPFSPATLGLQFACSSKPARISASMQVQACAVGSSLGSWWGFGEAGEAHGNQSVERGQCLSFTLSPAYLESYRAFGSDQHKHILLGVPSVKFRVASTERNAFVAIRVCEVDHTTGASEIVTWGVKNLRDVEPMDPAYLRSVMYNSSTPASAFDGQFVFDLAFELRPVARHTNAFGAPDGDPNTGSHLEVLLSTHLWPMIWPSPQPTTLTVIDNIVNVQLPHVMPLLTTIGCILRIDEIQDPRMSYNVTSAVAGYNPSLLFAHGDAAKCEIAAPLDVKITRPATNARSVSTDFVTSKTTVIIDDSEGECAFPALPGSDSGELVRGGRMVTTHSIVNGDLTSSATHCEHDVWLLRPQCRVGVKVETTTTMTSTAADFIIKTAVRAFDWKPTGNSHDLPDLQQREPSRGLLQEAFFRERTDTIPRSGV